MSLKKENNQNCQYIFTAQIEQIPKIIGLVLEKAQDSGMQAKRLAHLELALEELLVNIINYAYQSSVGEILVETLAGENDFKLTVIDKGVCFDPLSATLPDTTAKLKDRPIGGLGIMLIRNIMDEVHYTREAGRNKITFVIYKSPKPSPVEAAGKNL